MKLKELKNMCEDKKISVGLNTDKNLLPVHFFSQLTEEWLNLDVKIYLINTNNISILIE